MILEYRVGAAVDRMEAFVAIAVRGAHLRHVGSHLRLGETSFTTRDERMRKVIYARVHQKGEHLGRNGTEHHQRLMPMVFGRRFNCCS